MFLSIKILRKYFVLSAMTKWNTFDLNLRNSSFLNVWRNIILKYVTPSANSVFNGHNPKKVEVITRVRLVQSHLPEQKFKNSSQDLFNPVSNCCLDIESSWLICYKKIRADSNLINFVNELPHKLLNKLRVRIWEY